MDVFTHLLNTYRHKNKYNYMDTHTHTHDNTHIMQTVGDGHHSQNGSPSTGSGKIAPTP